MASALIPTAFSLVYGEPLVPFWGFATGVNGYNILHLAPLASPSLGGVPNRDTLYDLAHNDLVITVPSVKDRYYGVSFFDRELFTLEIRCEYCWRVFNPSAQSCDSHRIWNDAVFGLEYEGEIISPTTAVIIFVHMLVTSYSTDLGIAAALKSQFQITEGPVSPEARDMTLLSEVKWPDMANRFILIMQMLATLEPQNRPWNVTSEEFAEVDEKLALAGISNGSYVPLKDVEITEEQGIATSTVQQQRLEIQTPDGNGWSDGIPVGNGFAANWETRGFAYYTQLLNEEPYYTKPLLKHSMSTWGIALYQAKGTFFENTLRSYAFGDRSNITYLDGSLVYTGEDASVKDEPFQILIQP